MSIVEEIKALEERYLENDYQDPVIDPEQVETSTDQKVEPTNTDEKPEEPSDKADGEISLDGKSPEEVQKYLSLCVDAITEALKNAREIVNKVKSSDIDESVVFSSEFMEKLDGIVEDFSDMMEEIESEKLDDTSDSGDDSSVGRADSELETDDKPLPPPPDDKSKSPEEDDDLGEIEDEDDEEKSED